MSELRSQAPNVNIKLSRADKFKSHKFQFKHLSDQITWLVTGDQKMETTIPKMFEHGNMLESN